MLIIRAVIKLTRLDSSLLGFLAIFVPLLARTGNIALSLTRAIPLFFICICTFVANDLDDVDRDRVNHPSRPLPAGQITPAFAMIIYFASLGAALLSTKHYVPPGIGFGYYALIAVSISYGYLVECCPSLKAPYVAVVTSVPILIVAAWYPTELRLRFVAGAAFLFTLAREICMDIRDRDGDTVSFVHQLKPVRLAVVAFVIQFTGLLLLASQIRQATDMVDIVTIAIIFVLAGVCWFAFRKYKVATGLMKLQFFVGLYFLI